MKINDKFLAAFLVSLGLFSTTQATQYVSGLSAKDKSALCSVAQSDSKTAEPAGPSMLTVNQDNKF
jgi:hypothetical protein